MKYLVIVLAFFSSFSLAGDLLVGQYTYHFNERNDGLDYRSSHPLIGYDSGKYTFIAMRNSYDKDSVVALRTFKKELSTNIMAFVSAGIATGYYNHEPKTSHEKITAVGYFGFDFHPKNNNFGLVLTIVPDGFIGAGLRFKIR